MTISQPKLQQLHARLEKRRCAAPGVPVTTRDLCELIACFLETDVNASPPGAPKDLEAAVARLREYAEELPFPSDHATDVSVALTELARLRQQVIDAGRHLRIAEDCRVGGLAQNNRLIAEVKRQGEEIARLRAEAKPKGTT